MSINSIQKGVERVNRFYKPLLGSNYIDPPNIKLILEPTSTYPEDVRYFFSIRAQYLLDSINHNWQQISLTEPSFKKHSGQMLRAQENQNPLWYSNLYYATDRTNGSGFFRRKRVKTSLEKLTTSSDKKQAIAKFSKSNGFGANQRTLNKMDQLMRETICNHLTQGYYCDLENLKFPPLNEVRKYFGFRQVNQSQEDLDTIANCYHSQEAELSKISDEELPF